MKNYIENDYIITKKTAEDGTEKYYAQFINGEGKKQIVQVEKEVADAITSCQREEASLARKNRRYCVSLDDYSDKLSCRDVYPSLIDEEDLTRDQKVRKVLSMMGPEQAELLRMTFYEGLTQEEIAMNLGVQQACVSKRFGRAKKEFEKIFVEKFGKLE